MRRMSPLTGKGKPLDAAARWAELTGFVSDAARAVPMTILAWFRRRRDSPPPASAPEFAPPITPPAAALDRTARWFAGEPPARVELALATLRALAPAAPRPAEGAPPAAPEFGWLDAAFARLATLPEPLAPPGADDLAWRYLAFARALCDALEAAYTDALRAGRATRCPLTDRPDRYRAPRPRRPPHERSRLEGAGLGALLAGVRLPEAGRHRVLAAMARGIDWADPAAFWTACAARAPGAGSPATGASAGADPAPDPTPDPAPAAAAATAAELRAAVRAALGALVQDGAAFNRPHGMGWHAGGAFWVVAKPFAERLQDRLPAHPELHNRRTLYRRLAALGLLLPHGAQPVWALRVGAPGQPPLRYASALKLPAVLYDGPEPCPVYAGTLCAAAGVRAP